MNINWKPLLTSLICFVLPAMTGHTADFQSRESIEHAAYLYVFNEVQANYDNAQIVMDPLDSRLRLQACDNQLETFSNHGKIGLGKQTIGIRCNSPVAWSVYTSAKVKVFRPVVVTTRPLNADHIISKSDLKIQSLDIGSLRKGYINKPQQIIGQQLKYSLAMGTIINSKNLRPQKIIQRGELIMLVATAGQMEVRMSGTALSDGSLGQRVRVKIYLLNEW